MILKAKALYFSAAAIAACAVLVSCSSAAPPTVMEDPAGRFSYEVAADVIVEPADGPYRKYRYERPAMEGYILALDAPSEAEGLALAFRTIGVAQDALRLNGSSSYKEWRLRSFAAGGVEWKASATQYRSGTLYAVIVAGGADSSADSLPPSFSRMLTSFRFSGEAGEVFAPSSVHELERYVDEAIAPSGGAVSIAAIRGGEIVYRYASGLLGPGVEADEDAALPWASISKLVTGTAVMREVERGWIDLDAPADRYLPLPPPVNRITVRNLLSHASGLGEGMDVTGLVYYRADAMPALEEIWDRYLREAAAPLFAPGTVSLYNNYNFLALGLILERRTGQRFADYAEANVFKPLGMTNTGYFCEDLSERTAVAMPAANRRAADDALATLEEAGYRREEIVAAEGAGVLYLKPFDILSPWGGVKGSAADAARFAWMFLNDRAADSERVISPATARAMMKAQRSAGGSDLAYGLAFERFGEGKDSCVGHDGGGPGIESALRIYPRHKLVIAVLGSTDGYGADTIAEYLKDILTARNASEGASK